MFDIRPVNKKTGDLDWQKIAAVEIAHQTENTKKQSLGTGHWSLETKSHDQNMSSQSCGASLASQKTLPDTKHQSVVANDAKLKTAQHNAEQEALERRQILAEQIHKELLLHKRCAPQIKPIEKQKSSRFIWPEFSFVGNFFNQLALAKAGALVLLLCLPVVGFGLYGAAKNTQAKVLGVTQEGLSNLDQGLTAIKAQDFGASAQSFATAENQFAAAAESLGFWGKYLATPAQHLPWISKLSSGVNAIEAGQLIAGAGQELNAVLLEIDQLKKQDTLGEQNLLQLFNLTQERARAADEKMGSALDKMQQINVADLPQDKRLRFMEAKEKIATAKNLLDQFLANGKIAADLLGANGPRKYLFLFQNNTEMRATGGFIGSYGLLEMTGGEIKNFYIDGIYNPDGQLQERIVPPAPVQKMLPHWTLHDSNWFADFPTSAQKAMSFFEKTGGPTTDGVIAITPVVTQKLLALTGPVEMPEYKVTLDANNFLELTQQEVEINYDKTENKPKQILSDLAPILLARITKPQGIEDLKKIAAILGEATAEKHILVYAQNQELENLLQKQGVAGEIVQAAGDYLSVINTNIGGQKSDLMMQEKIKHTAEIQADGRIMVTLEITRTHTGGNTAYVWWNAENKDYMRIFVPSGSQLLEAVGFDRETIVAPVDYQALNFEHDQSLAAEENSEVDQKSGTKIYREGGKTVFANWLNTPPQESKTVKIKYVLPFKITTAESYKLYVQKQAGSLGSTLESRLILRNNSTIQNLGETTVELNVDREIEYVVPNF